jgi:hypothetical protein
MEGKRITFRLELEFMSEFGYYRLQTTDTLIVGDQNKKELEKIVEQIQEFAGLKPIPDWMTEESLKKGFPETSSVTRRK